jgi:hypothetical protein
MQDSENIKSGFSAASLAGIAISMPPHTTSSLSKDWLRYHKETASLNTSFFG